MSDREIDLIRGVNPLPDGLPAPPIEPVLRRLDQALTDPRSAPRRRPGLPTLGAMMAPLAAAVAVTVAVFAIVLLGHTRSHTARTPSAPATTTAVGSYPAVYRPLLSILGVLRRPQTTADRDPALLRTLNRQSQNRSLSVLDGRPVISLVRLATIAPWGAKIFLVPYRPLSRQAIAKLPAKQQVVARATKMSLGIYAAGLTSGFLSAAYIDAAEIWPLGDGPLRSGRDGSSRRRRQGRAMELDFDPRASASDHHSALQTGDRDRSQQHRRISDSDARQYRSRGLVRTLRQDHQTDRQRLVMRAAARQLFLTATASR